MTQPPTVRSTRLFVIVAALLVGGLLLPLPSRADETVMVCDIYGNHVAAQPKGAYGMRTSEKCPGNSPPRHYTTSDPPGGMAIWTFPHRPARRGEQVQWIIRAPTGLTISSIYIPHMYSRGIDDGSDWNGGLYWQGGSRGVKTFDGQSGWSSANSGGPSFRWPTGGTRYFGWRMACHLRRCSHAGHQWLTVELLEARVREMSAPHLVAPDGLWQAKGWIRGWWTLHFYGDSPTGLCATESILGTRAGPGSISARDPARWHQCAAPGVDQPVDTAEYGQGIVPLTIRAVDAAGKSVAYTTTLQVDNQPPTISLSGPNEASSTAGTQYLAATATAGPSGVAGIVCSLDGGADQWYPAASARVPVTGAGVHHISCYSESNAHDSSGSRAESVPATSTLTIRSPSVTTVSFVRIAHALRCVRRRERVRIGGHWTAAYHHGHRVRVWIPAQTRRVKVVHCHPRVVHRRVRSHGHWITKRVVLLPRSVSVSRLKVGFGQSATVKGWLGTPAGEAIGGRVVEILTAPSNGAHRFRQVAEVRTDGSGVWRAHLRPGPSRLVEAMYAGGSRFEPSQSQPGRLVVPAAIRLRIRPRRAHWAGAIRISGTLRGGYIPPAGEIVVLRVSWNGGSTETGHLYVMPGGRFSTTYTFRSGTGTQKYRFRAITLREADYPYAPGRSNRVRVTISP